MTASPSTIRAAAAALGPAAPPMVDDEPVFAEPWEGRAYGLALDIIEQRCLSWSAFRDRLIVAIAEAPQRPYYESWVVALERLAGDEQLVTEDELTHERADMGSYRYAEHGNDIEVTPLAHDPGALRKFLGADTIPNEAVQVELYRTFRDGGQVAHGVRSFDVGGTQLSDIPLARSIWEQHRDRLLSFRLE